VARLRGRGGAERRQFCGRRQGAQPQLQGHGRVAGYGAR
jgi:hypothetical protein